MLKSLCSQSLVNLFRTPAYRLVPGEEEDDDDDDEDFHILELEDMETLQSSLGSSSATGPWDTPRVSRDRATSFEITLTNQSRLLRIDHIHQISRHLPAALTVCTWSLVYSTHSHGSSLATLYRNMAKWESCVLIFIRDNHGKVFGAFCTSPLKVSSSFYGTGQGFLFSFAPRLQVYRWTYANTYFIKGGKEFLAFGGGGGHFGLWLCEDLIRGRSQRCETFNNDLLSSTEDFFIDELEVWALV